MTFDARENSLASGQPVTLFGFQRGTQQWNYSNGDRGLIHLGRTYTAIRGGLTIDGGISQGGDAGTEKVTIVAPADLDVAQLFRGIPPSDSVFLTIYERHFGDDEYRVSWTGEIESVSWPAVDRCKILCVPESISMQEQGLRLRWERGCPHCLYERGCYVDRYAYAVEDSIVSMNATAITVSAAAAHTDGWFNAGYVEWSIGNSNFERRAIEQHIGNQLTLLGGTSGLSPSTNITLFPGCDQTPTTCNSKFSNILNYGGVHHMPGRSPFDGNPFF